MSLERYLEPIGIMEPDATLEEALEVFSSGVADLAIMSRGRLVGILSWREALAAALLHNPGTSLIREHMFWNPLWVFNEDTGLEHIQDLMRAYSCPSMLVRDRDGSVMGVISSEGRRLFTHQA